VIQHVTWEVTPDRVEPCVAFYELLGFSRVEPPPSLRERATWVEREGTQIHLMYVDEPVTLPKGHVAVVVEDYEATFAALEVAGHGPDRRREHWGSPRCYVRDPAGNLVEVMAFPPESRRDRSGGRP